VQPCHLARAGYGALAEPFDPVAFWLDGTLTISALEQVEFLRRVILRSYPYRDSSYTSLRRVMLAETGAQHRLFAKTGWAARWTPQIGWYIGYVETADATWIFDLNMDTRSAADLCPCAGIWCAPDCRRSGSSSRSGMCGDRDGRDSHRPSLSSNLPTGKTNTVSAPGLGRVE
jgi:hypothetical protein